MSMAIVTTKVGRQISDNYNDNNRCNFETTIVKNRKHVQAFCQASVVIIVMSGRGLILFGFFVLLNFHEIQSRRVAVIKRTDYLSFYDKT